MRAGSAGTEGLVLQAGELRLALRPDLGGCIAGLWCGGLPVLWSAEPQALAGARPSGCFPLVPYSNRLGFRRFHWRGEAFETEPNTPGSPHAMHGVVWQLAWELLAATPQSVELRCTHVADGHWPFGFELRQQFHLTPDALTLRLRCTSTAATPQPVGLGWHPYFHKRPGSRLRTALTGRWEPDADGLPVRRIDHAGLDHEVAALALDHCFEGWSGQATMRDDVFALSHSSSLPRLVIYTPPDKGFYCVEPVSHVNNAIQMANPLAHGLHELMPGETLEAWMKLGVIAL